jgi:hypothetical protein
LTGYAVGGSGTILVTTDGGTWVEDARTGGPDRERRNLAVPNPFVSWARIPGHEEESFTVYDVSGRKAGSFQGGMTGFGLSPGVNFIQGPHDGSPSHRIVKLR